MRVFISYSWENMAHRDALIARIEREGYEAIWDQKYIPLGDDLNRGIINMLNRSDVAIAYLTKESIASKAVREELTRAHHQKLRICPIVHRSVIQDLPWFLQAPVFIQYETEEELAVAFDKLLEALKKDNKLIGAGEVHKIIQEQHDYASHVIRREKFETPEGKWSYELAIALLSNARDEMKALSTHHYSAIVSDGANFLMRAKPVFENASQVYAVSIDTVSSFWVSRETLDQRRALNYLGTQPDNTMRLFVFSSPDSAHNYVTMLNIHGRKYGTQGRVFICTKSAYRKIVDECATYQNDHGMFNCDFAVLEYKNPSGLSIHKATLDSEFFHVTRTNRNRGSPVLDEDEIRRVFSQLKDLKPGEIHSEYNVMRWEVDLQKRKDDWATKLHELFAQRDRDVLHLVFFTEQALCGVNAKARLRERIHDVQCLLEDVREDDDHSIHLKDVWFVESTIVHARDSRTRGRLHNDEAQRFPYLLLMRFDNQRSLEEWYELARHSEVRRNLYEGFDPKFKELFAAIDQIVSTNPNDTKIASMYEAIEGHAADFMRRWDYTAAETIHDIVAKKPFRPKIPFP